MCFQVTLMLLDTFRTTEATRQVQSPQMYLPHVCSEPSQAPATDPSPQVQLTRWVAGVSSSLPSRL